MEFCAAKTINEGLEFDGVPYSLSWDSSAKKCCRLTRGGRLALVLQLGEGALSLYKSEVEQAHSTLVDTTT